MCRLSASCARNRSRSASLWKYRCPAVAAAGDVVEGVGEVDPRRAGHEFILTCQGGGGKKQGRSRAVAESVICKPDLEFPFLDFSADFPVSSLTELPCRFQAPSYWHCARRRLSCPIRKRWSPAFRRLLRDKAG